MKTDGSENIKLSDEQSKEISIVGNNIYKFGNHRSANHKKKKFSYG
ncbi:MAG: hypothetical protein ACI8WT_001995 [Clostridium sp.]|jgi:hypothetical protein